MFNEITTAELCRKAELNRKSCIADAGGMYIWAAKPLTDRLEILGIDTNIPDEALKRYIGKAADTVEAAKLAKTNPQKYAMLKMLAEEKEL